MTERSRVTATARRCVAHCLDCEAVWGDAGAQGSAAHHHDLTGHTTVAKIEMTVTYGVAPAAPKLPPARPPGAPRRRQRAKAWR